MPLPFHTWTKRTPRSTSRRASRQRPPKSARLGIVEAVQLLRRLGFAADVGRFGRRHLHAERELVRLHARRQFGIVIARFQVLLVQSCSVASRSRCCVRLHALRAASG